MKTTHLLIAMLCLTGSALTAQCAGLSNSCPTDETYELRNGQRDTTIMITTPETTGCQDKLLFYDISGPSVKAGTGLPGSFTFPEGESSVDYVYTDMRFGNFVDTAIILPDNTIDTFKIPLSILNTGSGTTVGEAGGLTKICFVMEHSYLGDLDMYVTCPNGTTIPLHSFSTSDDVQRQLLGQGNEFTESPDPGARYCWTMNGEKTMAEYVTDFNLGDNVMMPSIDYAPEQAFSLFDQCPIDGNWTLYVKDNLSNDNGSISSAYIDFGEVSSACTQSVTVIPNTTGLFSRSSPTPAFNLTAYPNPMTDLLRLTVDARRAGSARLEVFTVDGKQLNSRDVDLLVGENTHSLTTTSWPTGVYSVRVASGGAEQWTRVVKAR